MSSSIAGSVVVTILDIPHNRSNITAASNSSHRLTSVSSFETIHRATMVNNNATETQDQPRVILNIRGTIYETLESTLARFPHTLLGSLNKSSIYYNPNNKQYYFNRNKEAFDSILYYYQSMGKLIRPQHVKEDVFLEELEFFQIDPYHVAQLEYGSSNFKIPEQKTTVNERDRDSSTESKYTLSQALLSWPCGVMVILYMLTLSLSSERRDYQLILPISCGAMPNKSSSTTVVREYNHPLNVLQYICAVWFLLEFIHRLCRAERKLGYMRSILGIADIISVLSIFFQIFLHEFDMCVQSLTIWLANAARILSLLTMFKLSRYSTGLRLFGLTVKACAGQLILSFYCVGICLLVFSFIIYYSEESDNSSFGSILDALWYTTVTLTTVGYGDIVPITMVGKMFGGLCSVLGVAIVMAWPATIFVSYFQEIYNHKIGQKKKKSRKFWSNKIFMFRKGLMQLDTTGCTFK